LGDLTYAKGMKASGFHPAVSRWFTSRFEAPTEVQRQAWAAVRNAPATLISAPTGSGKTLAAFLAAIDDLVVKSLGSGLMDQTYVLYVSPLKALSNDIQRNLQAPLLGISQHLLEEGLGHEPIRAWVRTGDTPHSERARMRQRPPHILVTTPESLYILLTSDSGRRMLATVETVIVDEIHALAGNKRGAHLALSLERLAALCARPLKRIGVSATSKPMHDIARFLVGQRDDSCTLVDAGHLRTRDLALELPPSPLEAVMAGEVWTDIYDRLAELTREHRTTLIFVNTRRMAERVARHLAERLGEAAVTAHHGSLAKEHRLAAEERLKAGQLRALVATASLELGIDIGEIDLVCQLGSPRAIASFLQRVGRSGHGLGRIPKGRLFPLSRDELVECVALIHSAREGQLDAVRVCRAPLDVLAQQIVAETAMRDWNVDELFACLSRSGSFAELSKASYMSVVSMLANGFTTHRGRRAAHLHFDRVNGLLRGRRGARLTAITNGGVIPDQFDYDVLLGPSEQFVGTLNEDFAFESLPGDIFQLGNTSYRITRVVSGKVYVDDAQGQPPSIPFWFGEAPGRSDELSSAVSALRCWMDAQLASCTPSQAAALAAECFGLDASAAEQLVDYLASSRAALGGLPHAGRIVLERFFDESGDAHLVIHSTYGSRINRAWGLALRKRFCRRFNFELQAAALEDAIVISLGAVHSFTLDEVPRYLHSRSVRETLTQAVLAAPVFPGRWRWNATTALAVRRFHNGKRAPAPFQRNDAEDLLATVFPDQLACAENIVGERTVPDHPLVEQTLADCLETVMDIEGLERLLADIEAGRVEVRCCELTSPSPLAQEVLVAKPYAFLDDAPAEERRTLAVQARRYLSVEQASELGRLDPDAIARVRKEAWPDPRSADELYEALTLAGFMSAAEAEGVEAWRPWLAALGREGRAALLSGPRGRFWVSADRVQEMSLVCPDLKPMQPIVTLDSPAQDRDQALREILRSRLEVLGPVTAQTLAASLSMACTEVRAALAALEQEGFAMQGFFSAGAAEEEEWCERRLLARIHRYTLTRLRSEIEPVSLADYQRFLFRWQGLGEHCREGPDALAAIVGELQGLSLPAAAWERDVLPARLAHYSGDLIDLLSSRGETVWWRPWSEAPDATPRATAIANVPVVLLPRSAWQQWKLLSSGHAGPARPETSSGAARVEAVLRQQGALFFVEIVQATGLLRVQVETALAELAAAGLVTADAFQGLRALITPPSRRRGFRGRSRARGPSFDAAGRWVWNEPLTGEVVTAGRDAAIEHAARCLLRRYGVVCRAVLGRETAVPSWRELLRCYRRWEASGEIRGGRFVSSLSGEQYALSAAVEKLRQMRRESRPDEWQLISAADPLNLIGVLDAQRRVPSVATHRVLYRNGIAVAARGASGIQWLAAMDPVQQSHAQRCLMGSEYGGDARPVRTRAGRGRA
jgi:ATP-dependent Lhr-like helicase